MSKKWFVVHAYSGFEKSVSRALEDRDANLNWRPGSRALERLLAA